MFTGLIEAVGRIDSIHGGSQGLKIGIFSPGVSGELTVGDSINVDGVCQTVVAVTASTFSVEAVGDTLAKTTFQSLKPGSPVNLERALRADSRLGGHIVMGHVNGTGRILSWRSEAQAASAETSAWFLSLELEPSWADRVVPEGSIAVDGISLTVADVERSGGLSGVGRLRARISVIPHTRKATTLGVKREGDLVNIELDLLASYVHAATGRARAQGSGLTLEKLSGWGYS